MVTLKLTQDELAALAGLLDAGVRQVGLRGVKDAAKLIEKIEAAANEQSNVVDMKEASNG